MLENFLNFPSLFSEKDDVTVKCSSIRADNTEIENTCKIVMQTKNTSIIWSLGNGQWPCTEWRAQVKDLVVKW